MTNFWIAMNIDLLGLRSLLLGSLFSSSYTRSYDGWWCLLIPFMDLRHLFSASRLASLYLQSLVYFEHMVKKRVFFLIKLSIVLFSKFNLRRSLQFSRSKWSFSRQFHRGFILCISQIEAIFPKERGKS